MNTILVLLFAALVCVADAADIYPVHPINPSPMADDSVLMEPFSQSIASLINAKLTDLEKAKFVRDAVTHFESSIQEKTVRQWSLVRADGRMPIPSILLHPNHYGLDAGVDAHYFVDLMATDPGEQAKLFSLGLLWSGLMQRDAPAAFKLMSQAAARESVNTSDILRLFASLGYMAGDRLPGAPDKSDWQLLHNSKNPCYRLIALEKFDSVEQSPAELLALYRECLFGACSYLEVRALEAITRNKDFRQEVAKLLEEYIASNPPENDGTLPSLRNNFPNLIEGAKRVVATIRNTEKPAAPTSPQVDPFAQTTPTPKPPPVVQPPAPKKSPEAEPTVPTPTEEPASSTPWSIVVVLIVAATGLLWLLLKKRK